MTNVRNLALGLAAVALLAAGCDSKTDPAQSPMRTSKGSAKSGDHDHGEGPNGGVIFDLGKYHAEFTVDHAKKECTVLFIEGDDKDAKPLPVAAKELTLTTKPSKTKEGKDVPAMTIKMLPQGAADGKASKFVGTDPVLANVADFEGTVIGDIDGKPAQGTFKE